MKKVLTKSYKHLKYCLLELDSLPTVANLSFVIILLVSSFAHAKLAFF